jgi:iron complex outermembrane receptor protein
MSGFPARSGARRTVRITLALPALALALSAMAAMAAIAVLVWPARANAQTARADDSNAPDEAAAGGRRLPTARVTAIRPAELPQDPSSFATVIDAGEHAGEGESVESLLGESVGVQLRSFGGPGQPSEISIRGSTGPQVVVLLDGVRLNTAQSGTVDLSTIPLAMLDRIEVSRGVGGAQSGSGAIGGVVNLVTKGPTGERGTTAAFSGGSFGTWQGSLSHSDRAGPFDYAGSYSGFTTEGDFEFQSVEFETDAGTIPSRGLRRVNGDSESHSALLQAGGDLAPGLRASGSNHFYYVSRGQPGPDQNAEVPYGGQSPTAHDRNARNVASLRLAADGWDALPDAVGLESVVSYLYEQSRFREPEPTAGLPISIRQKNRSGAWRTQGRLDGRALAAEHQASLGLDLRYDTLSSTDEDHHRRTSVAIVLADEIGELGDHALPGFLRALSLLPSVRFEHTDDFGEEWIPHLGLVWTPVAWLRFKGNVERSYRVPSFDELYFPDKGFIRGNRNLRPERALGGDVGFELGLEKLGWLEDVRVQAAWFSQDIENSIVWQRISIATVEPTNTNDARVQGIELAGSFALFGWVELSANWTHQEAELDQRRQPDVPGEFPPILQRPGRALPGSADDEVHVRVRVGPGSELWKVVGEQRYTSKLHLSYTDEPTLSARSVYDLSLAVDVAQLWRLDARWFPKKVLASVSVLNLADESVRDSVGFPLPGRTLTFGVEAAW